MNDEDLKKDEESSMNENEENNNKVDTQEESMMGDFEVDDLPVDDTNLDVEMSEETDKEMDKEADEAAEDLTKASSDDEIPSNWIEVKDGKFLCKECENESEPETNTVDGTVTADTAKIMKDLQEKPTRIIYGSCPVCGMEYLFKEKNGTLYMEPSEMLK